MLPVFSCAKGMEHTGLQREDGEKRLSQIQHPDRGIYGTNMLSVLDNTNEGSNDLIKGKEGRCNDQNLPLFHCPVPVDHLKYKSDQRQMHQQDQNAAETVGLPLLLWCPSLLSAEDLKQLDQCLNKVINTIAADPGRAINDTGTDLIAAISKIDDLFPI